MKCELELNVRCLVGVGLLRYVIATVTSGMCHGRRWRQLRFACYDSYHNSYQPLKCDFVFKKGFNDVQEDSALVTSVNVNRCFGNI